MQGRIEWTFASQGYRTQHLLSVQKHLSLIIEWLCWLLMF